MDHTLKYFKLHNDVKDPVRATEGSACFDVFLYMPSSEETINFYKDSVVLVNTGLIFDIPKNFHIKLYERSSTCLKTDLELANKVGIIDSDYRYEVLVPIRLSNRCKNNSLLVTREVLTEKPYFQIEFCKSCEFVLKESKDRPFLIKGRTGGFGSTS